MFSVCLYYSPVYLPVIPEWAGRAKSTHSRLLAVMRSASYLTCFNIFYFLKKKEFFFLFFFLKLNEFFFLNIKTRILIFILKIFVLCQIPYSDLAPPHMLSLQKCVWVILCHFQQLPATDIMTTFLLDLHTLLEPRWITKVCLCTLECDNLSELITSNASVYLKMLEWQWNCCWSIPSWDVLKFTRYLHCI